MGCIDVELTANKASFLYVDYFTNSVHLAWRNSSHSFVIFAHAAFLLDLVEGQWTGLSRIFFVMSLNDFLVSLISVILFNWQSYGYISASSGTLFSSRPMYSSWCRCLFAKALPAASILQPSSTVITCLCVHCLNSLFAGLLIILLHLQTITAGLYKVLSVCISTSSLSLLVCWESVQLMTLLRTCIACMKINVHVMWLMSFVLGNKQCGYADGWILHSRLACAVVYCCLNVAHPQCNNFRCT